MLKKLGICLFVGIFLMLSGNVSATICYCNSCTDCTDKLNNITCKVVKLNASIINHTGTCINNPVNFTNKTFDCQGFRIDGDKEGIDAGIYLYKKNNNTIKNCIVTDFYIGLFITHYSLYSTLTNNTANNNSYGITLYFSSNNTVINNTMNNNNETGLYIYNSLNNSLINNIANNNTYGFYLYDATNTTINNNFICRNSGWDFYSDLISFGTNNTCGKVRNFRDHNYYLCTKMCPSEDPFHWWYLMILPAAWYLYYFKKRKEKR